MPRTTKPFPRYLASRLREALADTPVVLIHGPRQSGKTTLARAVGERRGYRYFSFDIEAARGGSRGDDERVCLHSCPTSLNRKGVRL